MKKINPYSAQFKTISEQPKQNHPNEYTNQNTNNPNKKNLTKDRQEFMNNIAASRCKDFSA